MMSLPDRRTLESMRRADLQKLCKERGLKANMKTEAIIDLLIDTDKPIAESSGATHKRSSSMRIVSRPPSSSGGRNRVGSMVIHDTDNEEEPEDGMRADLMDAESIPPNPATSQPSQIPMPTAGPATRTRRAGDDQRRLGLGRPKALGGTGIRAPPRTASTTQIKKARSAPSIRPVELPIPEEEEEQMPQAGPSGTSHDPPTNRSSPLTEQSSQQLAEAAAGVSPASGDVIASLQAQLEQTQAEVQRLASNAARTDSLQSAVDELRAEVAALRSQTRQQSDVEAQLKAVREELVAMRMEMSAEFSRTRMPSVQSTELATTSHESTAAVLPASSSGEFLTESSLGKRHRTSGDMDITGIIDEGEVAELAAEIIETQVVRPTRKKPRLAERESSKERGRGFVHAADNEGEDDYEVMPVSQPTQRGPAFTVFSGQEEPPEPLSNAPPATRLSDLFATSTPPSGVTPSLPTSSARGAENQLPHTGNNAFTFSFANSIFQPVTSTPAAQLTMPAPEPPTSPTPAYVERAGGRRERNDPFYPTGRPQSRTSRPASRNAQASSSSAADALRPAPTLAAVAEEPRAGTATTASATAGPLQRADSLSIPGLVPLPVAPDTPAPPMRRTMYGTELEMDTRFGDFGVEGVATMGFGWGAAPRY